MLGTTRAVCLREHQASLRHSVKQLLEDKIKHWRVQDRFRIQDKLITVDNGGMIIFQGMKNHTSDSIKSLEAFDVAWVEEAQRFSKRSFNLLYPTIRKEGSQLWFCWNPMFPTDPVDSFFRGGKPPDKSRIVGPLTYRDNPWVSKVTLDDMEYDKRRSPDTYKHIWLGEYDRKSTSRVFTRWRIGELAEFDALDRSRPRYGCDFGFAKDPTVLLEMFVVDKTLYVTREAYKVGLEIDHTPDYFRECIPGAEDWPIRADGARPETISYLRRNGFKGITAATKGPGSVKEGVEFLKSFDIVIHPDCSHTIDEFMYYSYKIDPQTEEVLPILQDEKNHTIDAARYGVEALRRGRAGVF